MQSLTPRQTSSLPDPSLKIWQLPDRKLSCFYAPFEHVNTQAKLIIVGITPGRSQMNRSINALNHALSDGQSTQQALKSVKQSASLSGTMRPRLVDMLNRLGYAQKLGIACCSSLWGENNNLVHFCSVLKYPIFVNGKDYSGQPKIFNVPQLKSLLFEQFVNDVQSINPSAHLMPLGEMVAEVLMQLDQRGDLKHFLPRFGNHIVSPPHPSGANAESIALVMAHHYPSLTEYQESMYEQYLTRRQWLKKPNSQPQDIRKYKKARASRWYAMFRVRQAYGL
ncbi:MAG: uracil-DNA glycosylase [Methylophagaceae bacterium]|jgi:uracil-DNA glycosylase